MKRNCNNCKALIKAIGNRVGCQCQLGHPIIVSKEVYGLPVEYKPAVECEKPLTYKDLCLLDGHYVRPIK